eukprot:1152272-Pelagomonas_calceolata.AAC.9
MHLPKLKSVGPAAPTRAVLAPPVWDLPFDFSGNRWRSHLYAMAMMECGPAAATGASLATSAFAIRSSVSP